MERELASVEEIFSNVPPQINPEKPVPLLGSDRLRARDRQILWLIGPNPLLPRAYQKQLALNVIEEARLIGSQLERDDIESRMSTLCVMEYWDAVYSMNREQTDPPLYLGLQPPAPIQGPPFNHS